MPAPLDPECIFKALQKHRVEYVLVGGLAGVLHGSPAMTNDADIVPALEPKNLEHLTHTLRDLGALVRTSDEPAMGVLNMTTRCGDLDLTFSPTGLHDYDALVANSVAFDIGRCRVQVAALADIIRSKTAAGREKDHMTLPILRALEEEIRRKR